jgi:bifunctional non-homologous end joining protein LigD
MLSRSYSSRGRLRNAPAAFIPFCLPSVSQRPPRGPGWAHELKHDGYRLQIHVRDGRVRLYTMNGADWTSRYPIIVAEASRLDGSAVIDAEVVCVGEDGVPDFELLHDRTNDHIAIACAFDLLMRNGEDLRRNPFAERKAALRKLLRRSRDGIQYVEHTEGDGEEMFQAACKLGLEGIVSKRVDAPYRFRHDLGSKSEILKLRQQRGPRMVRSEYWGRRDGDSGGPSSRFTLVGVPRNRHFSVMIKCGYSVTY